MSGVWILAVDAQCGDGIIVSAHATAEDAGAWLLSGWPLDPDVDTSDYDNVVAAYGDTEIRVTLEHCQVLPLIPCDAVLSLGDDKYVCEEPAPHPGVAHRSLAADANWCSDGEARAAVPR